VNAYGDIYQIVYGLLAAPRLSLVHLPRLVVWVWLYLLQFCAANQKFSPEEDALNKPYRPIPAGLISVEATVVLRWLLVPVCLGLSFAYDIVYPGLSLTIAFIVYNELGFDSAWYTKNFLNAVGLVSWNIGAAKIAGGGECNFSSVVWRVANQLMCA
jgi:4-hydroxybenzoate polyprenyltransferase